jgi:hypothetical protein
MEISSWRWQCSPRARLPASPPRKTRQSPAIRPYRSSTPEPILSVKRPAIRRGRRTSPQPSSHWRRAGELSITSTASQCSPISCRAFDRGLWQLWYAHLTVGTSGSHGRRAFRHSRCASWRSIWARPAPRIPVKQRPARIHAPYSPPAARAGSWNWQLPAL